MKLSVYLRTASYLLTLSLVAILGAVPLLLFASLPARWRFDFKPFYWCMDLIYRLLIKSLWVPVTFVGAENIPFNGPLIFAANHASAIDIFLVGSLVKGQPHTALAWYALANYPVFGYLLRRMCVLVDTRSPRRAVAAIHEAGQLLAGTSRHLIIFPEGGRFTSGKIHDFFLGFAILARQTARPVIPVLLVNTAKVCEPKTILIHYASIQVIIGKPFVYQEGESTQQFLDRVHQWFVEQHSVHVSALSQK